MSRTPCVRVLLLGLAVASCVGVRQETRHEYQDSTIPFTRKEVEGWRYDLLSMHHVFSIHFKAGGYAPATIGSGNTLAAPGYRWKIDQDGRLLISDDEGPFAVYQLLSKKGDKVGLWNMTTGRTDVFFRVMRKGGPEG